MPPGGENDAQNITPNTKLIVNCTKDIPFFYSTVNCIRIPVDDNDKIIEHRTILEHWLNGHIFKMIENEINKGNDVLIHCKMGRQTSAATVAAFLKYKNPNVSMDEILKIIKTIKRDAFFPGVNFADSLTYYVKKNK